MTDQRHGAPTEAGAESGARPHDVDTGFWLWIVALPLMVVGYVVNLVTTPTAGPPGLVYAISGVFVTVVVATVLTFILLLRSGYRWVRTVLTGSSAATVVYAVTNLFDVDRPPVAAVLYAAVTIFGSVCVVGGVYLLHRKDAHLFFTR